MIRIVKLTFKEEHILDFKLLFETRKELIRTQEGCSHLALWQDNKEARIFYTYSIWHEELDLNRYRDSDLFSDTWTIVKQWFADKPIAFSANEIISLS
jgi:heme-degrading monooxygenase HmoA